MTNRKRRKSLTVTKNGLAFQEVHELGIRMKKLEGRAKPTLDSYEKTFNDFERFLGCKEIHDKSYNRRCS